MVKELNRLKVPFVCAFVGLFADSKNLYIVQELGTEGDLFTWSSTLPNPGPRREEQLRPIAIQVCAAVRYLHDLGVAHRDLSLENCLVTKGSQKGVLTVKVIDYAMCEISRFSNGSAKHGKGAYQAPEMHMEEAYDLFLADNFAVGFMIYAMAMRRYAWKSTILGKDRHFDYAWINGIHRFLALKPNPEDKEIGTMSPPLVDVLSRLLHMQPKCRASLGETCFHHEGHRTCISNMEWMAQKE